VASRAWASPPSCQPHRGRAGRLGRAVAGGGDDDVERRDGEGEGPGLATRAFAVSAAARAPRGNVRRIAARVQRSEQERWRMDGRFGRCRGCERVQVFCGSCASVGACCEGCAPSRGREAHRRANRAYARTPKGLASNRARQARRRGRIALNRRRVTDTISTQEQGAPTPPSPSRSEVEPTRDTEVSIHAPSNRSEVRRPAAGEALRCARCGRTLSARVRPSEWTPPRRPRRRRAPRLPRARER